MRTIVLAQEGAALEVHRGRIVILCECGAWRWEARGNLGKSHLQRLRLHQDRDHPSSFLRGFDHSQFDNDSVTAIDDDPPF